MLEAMTCRQYLDWLAFYREREARLNVATGKGEGYGTSREGKKRLSGDLLGKLRAYQQRRQKRRA